jgi:hypothetical protein
MPGLSLSKPEWWKHPQENNAEVVWSQCRRNPCENRTARECPLQHKLMMVSDKEQPKG